MRAADALIERISASSRIPSAARRREVTRELHAHIDDLIETARQAGRSEEEIERLLLSRFGDPAPFARNFAWVYRRERAMCAIFGFALASIALASVITAGTLATQAGVAAGFGTPLARSLAPQHTFLESRDIFATAALYLAALSLERLFQRRASLKAIALLSALTTALAACLAAAGAHTSFLIFGFAAAVLLRAVQLALPHPAARFAAAITGFGSFGAWMWGGSAASTANWLILGAGYQLMTTLAARFDRRLFHRLQLF